MAVRHAVLIGAPVALTAIALHAFWTHDLFAYDFNHFYWPAGDRVLHGLSPYIYGDWFPSETKVGFVYPAPTALLFAGVAILPREVGEVLFTALSIAGPLLALLLLGVRDWRLYGLLLLWPPILNGWQCANLSMVLVVGVAALWRYRGRSAASGVLLGLLISLKLFFWPLGFFLLATRRYGGLASAAVTVVAVNGIAWLAVGLDEIPRYRATVQSFSHLREDAGFSVLGFVQRLGGDRASGYAAAMGLVALAGLGCVVLARRGHEQGAFVLGVAACLLATPIMWLHYLVFLIVPLALRYPRLHPLWALPLLMWFSVRATGPATWQVGFVLTISTIMIAGTLMSSDRRSAPRRRRLATAVAD